MANPPKGYSENDRKERLSRIVLHNKLKKHLRRVVPHIEVEDKKPNYDGYLDLLDGKRKPVGELRVQLKTMGKGKRKFSCDTAYISYSTRINMPFILICVDIKDEIVYWKRLHTDLKKGRKKQASVTVDFEDGDEIGDNKNFLEKWFSLSREFGLQAKKSIRGKSQIEATPVSPQKAGISSSKTTDDEKELENSKYKTLLNEAKQLLDKKMFKSAQAIYGQIIQKMKRDKTTPRLARFKALNNLASCYLNLGQDDLAGENFVAAFEILSEKSELALRNRALASLLLNQPSEGLKFIDAAIKLKPKNNENYHLKAALLRKIGRSKEADDLFFDNGDPDEN